MNKLFCWSYGITSRLFSTVTSWINHVGNRSYTVMWLLLSPTIPSNPMLNRPCGCRGVCYRELRSPESHPLQPYNITNSIALGMNIIQVDSWYRALGPPGVGFGIDCLAVVECCSSGLGVSIFRVGMQGLYCIAFRLSLSAETSLRPTLDLRVWWLSLAFRLDWAGIFA